MTGATYAKRNKQKYTTRNIFIKGKYTIANLEEKYKAERQTRELQKQKKVKLRVVS